MLSLINVVVHLPWYAANTKAGYIAYETLKRPLFGIGVSWIIYACVTGNAGIIYFPLCLYIV